MAMRNACGSTTNHIFWNPLSATASAASAWPRGDRLDRAADDLGDVAGGVDHEREEQREERRVDAHPAARRPPLDGGHAPRVAEREPDRRPPRRRTRGRPTGRIAPARPCGSTPIVATGRPPTRRAPPIEQDQQQPPPAATVEPRHGDAAVGEDDQPEEVPGVVDVREHAEHDDEQAGDEEQGERDVAHDLDVDRGDLAHDPVLRQPADADERAEDRRRDDAGDRHPQACSAGPGERVADRCALRQRVAGDLERRRVVEEFEVRSGCSPARRSSCSCRTASMTIATTTATIASWTTQLRTRTSRQQRARGRGHGVGRA